VFSFSETFFHSFAAASEAFRIASETSWLTKPVSHPSIVSPATIKALKLKRRPPFTTFAQRFINTTFSLVSPFAVDGFSCLRESGRLPEVSVIHELKL